jgi:hypothetical protein
VRRGLRIGWRSQRPSCASWSEFVVLNLNFISGALNHEWCFLSYNQNNNRSCSQSNLSQPAFISEVCSLLLLF